MPLRRTNSGQIHPDTGLVVYNYEQVHDDGTRVSSMEPGDPRLAELAEKPVILTGPVRGDITLSDGTTYNVSDDWVEVASHAHKGELSHHIGLIHERDGHPNALARTHPDYDPAVDEFVHECDDECGPQSRLVKSTAKKGK